MNLKRRIFLLTMPLLLLACFFINQNSLAAQTNQWTLASSTMPTARTGMSSVVIGQKIYVLGGRLYMNALSHEDKNEVYDTENDVWETKAPMPTGRWGATAATVDGKLFLVAAGSPIPQGSQNLEEYNPESDSWSQKAEMPQPGWGAVSAVADGKIYVVGGYNWANQGMNYNREYDPKTNIWTLKAPMPTSRSWLGAEAINGKIYVVGGWNWNDTVDLATLEIYDPKTDIWETKAPMPKGLRGIATAALDNKLYVIGGEQGDGYNPVLHDSVLVYDPATNLWQELSVKLPKPISVAEAQTVAGVIYLIGGYTYGQELNSVYYWSEKTSAPEPVILVPGIMGSDLINASNSNDKIWLDTNRLIGSLSDDFLSDLAMDNNGNTINAINVGDAIREIKVLGAYNSDVLQGLISYLQIKGYQENQNLFIFPYDWRQKVDLTATQLNQKILDVLAQTGSQQVNIIAHSLGGLVTKDYMKKYANQNKINKFIDIATPHFGSPKAFKVLRYGDNLGVKVILSENRMKTISQNMPSVYELLPSAAYYDAGHIDYNFIYSDQGHKYDYEDINSYLRIWNNPILVNQAKEFHNNIDDYNSYASSAQTYNIIGCGFATIGKIIKLNQEKDHNEYLIDYINGDGTVPLKSAAGMTAYKKYYYDGAEHMSLPSANGVVQLVNSILDGEESQFDLSPYPMSAHSDICRIRGKLVTYHSPITLHAYDEEGRHVGPNADGNIDNQIPGAQYDIIEDNKFVFLPSGHTYHIVGQATGLGAFNSRVKTIDNGLVTQTAYYNQVPIITLDTNIEMAIKDNQIDYTMKIDQDGDQIFETTTQPSSILNEQESADPIKPETIINILGAQGNDNWYTSSVQISFTASDNEDGSGILKTEYSLDNGQIWQVYTDNVIYIIDKQGVNKILFKSTDRAGNIEEEKISEFKIDSTPPTLEIITPLDNDEYDHAGNLEILYNSIDSVSGLNNSATETQIDGQNVSATSIDLFLYRLGGHQLIIKIVDLAGNQIATTVPFFIITSIPGMIDDIERLYFEKQIIKTSTKDKLIKELNSLQQYLERFDNRQDKRLSKYQERLAKCDKLKKRAADCRESVKKLYERREYALNKTRAKVVASRLADLLKDLEKYYAKKWLTPQAYEMIKEELIYLKSNY